MRFIEKIGNIKVYTEKNSDNDITVSFYNGSDCVMSEVYFTNNENAAIENLFIKMDIYMAKWIREHAKITDLTILSENTYRVREKHWFCRIDGTRFFKHFLALADDFITDKNGMRIIDR